MKHALLMIALFYGIHALCQTDNNHKLIDALVEMPDPGEVYYDDGAGDGTILRSGEHKDYILTKALPEVESIVALKDAALPLLIDCSTDLRRTNISFSPSALAAPSVSSPIRVPVAFVCLDILSAIVNRHPKIFDPESCDGMGCEYSRGFYFKPEVLEVHGQTHGLGIIQNVQAHWLKAHRRKWIHWMYPEIWSLELKPSAN